MKKIIGISFFFIALGSGVLLAQSKGADTFELSASRIGPAGLSSGGNFSEQGLVNYEGGVTLTGGQFSEDPIAKTFSITPFPSAWVIN